MDTSKQRDEWLFSRRMKPAFGAIVSILLTILIGGLDLVTDDRYEVSLFYIIPIAVSLIALGSGWGYFFSAVCAALWIVEGLVSSTEPVSFKLAAWNLVSRLLYYFLFSFLLARLLDYVSRLRATADGLQAANEEKALLLRELHHRVKNSMASIAGLVGLEKSASDNKHLSDILERFHNRILSMASLYDLLFHSSDSESVQLSEYLRKIIAYLEDSFAAERRGMRIESRLDDIRLDSKRAMSIGMIANELITDSFKYAHPSGEHGTISVGLSRSEHHATFEVSDDGIGLSLGPSGRANEGFGLTLVGRLAADLGGSLEILPGSGAHFRIRFLL